MKRYLPIVFIMLFCIFSENVHAASGSISVTVPQEAKGSTAYYAKVAQRDALEEDQVEELLQQEISYEDHVEVSADGAARIEDLQEGVYRIQISGENGYEFTNALVSIPMWDEEAKHMIYDVTILPKYSYHPPEIKKENHTPITGDESKTGIYIGVGIISLIIVVIMSCHNRFKCARMSE